jgi:hypothetical protein
MARRSWFTFTCFAASLAGALLAAGCASGATAKGMTVVPGDVTSATNPALARAVAVGVVAGGESTNPAWSSNVDNDEFRAALTESLRAQGLLAEGPGRYELVAALVALDKPLFGFDMTVTTRVRYALRDRTSQAVVLEEEVAAVHTATVGDAFYGVTRLRLANEGSVRRNIAALIDKLNALKVGPGAVSLR